MPLEPRGLRNNNPLNLSYIQGQNPWVIGSDSRFGQYSTPEEGIAGAINQWRIYQSRGQGGTISSLINLWAPSSENNTGGYVSRVSSMLGLSPDAPVDLNNPGFLARLAGAMSSVENGRPLDPSIAERGVDLYNNWRASSGGASQPSAQGSGMLGRMTGCLTGPDAMMGPMGSLACMGSAVFGGPTAGGAASAVAGAASSAASNLGNVITEWLFRGGIFILGLILITAAVFALKGK